MPQSAEDSVRIAILSEPSAFGLSASDTNPMLLYQLRKDDQKYCEQGTAELWKLCFDSVNGVQLLLFDTSDDELAEQYCESIEGVQREVAYR
jgi:hypothetical protein